MSRRGKLQRNLVFVIVVAYIGAESHEERQLAVAQTCGVVYEFFGMNPHLELLVIAEVVGGETIDGPRFRGQQIFGGERKRLLVELHDLGLSGVGDVRHSGGEHIVHGRASGVFLNVDGGDVEASRGGGVAAVGKVEFVRAPLASHQLERGEAEVGGTREAGHEYAGEAYG